MRLPRDHHLATIVAFGADVGVDGRREALEPDGIEAGRLRIGCLHPSPARSPDRRNRAGAVDPSG
jgi:hypothetical protein